MAGDKPPPERRPVTIDLLYARWVGPARRRRMIETAACAAPVLLAATVIAWRVAGPTVASAVAIFGIMLVLVVARRRAAAFDQVWLVRSLDRTRPELEDSSALLFTDQTSPSPLLSLQRHRVATRLDQGSPDDLRPPLPTKTLAAVSVIAMLCVVAALVWPRSDARPPMLAPSREGTPVVPGVPRLVAQNMRIIPPAYTGLPVRDSASLDTRAPQGSRIEWTLRFEPAATVPRLVLLGGSPVALRRSGTHWIASRTLDAAFLYRVDPGGRQRKTPPLHRIDAVIDAPPQIKILSPEQSLSIVQPGQRSWSPVFVATDDYGVAPVARLRVTLAMGEGENVRFTEREIPINGIGSTKERRFAPALAFGQFGFVAGGDMVVQLIIRDNRAPAPQEMRGPSLVLRWPSPKQPESSGLTGMVNTTLPAYFRSQRQIIIDAEALIKQRRALSGDRYLKRSTAIGEDQQILRGRYSQFLGGEEKGERQLPTSDDHTDGDGHDHGDGHTDGDGHDHGGAPATPSVGFGAPEDVLAEFGHPHDDSPASSLAPGTRAILKQAVDEMWQSERELKLGHPDLALPYAYKALRFIKEVQQATRVFLSRVGPELPPIDPTRRMTGKREGIAGAALPVVPVERNDGPAAAAWRALGDGPDAIPGPIDLGPLDRWVRASAARVPDALALSGAIDAVRQEPGCTSCRAKLRALLWTTMERPLGQSIHRVPPNESGRRYLRAIQDGSR